MQPRLALLYFWDIERVQFNSCHSKHPPLCPHNQHTERHMEPGSGLKKTYAVSWVRGHCEDSIAYLNQPQIYRVNLKKKLMYVPQGLSLEGCEEAKEGGPG